VKRFVDDPLLPGSTPPINTQYILAGMIVSKASGMSYADALKEMIFEPLQLHQSQHDPAP
jgi:CubicO group peptidase (beta-lactamase class C family)